MSYTCKLHIEVIPKASLQVPIHLAAETSY